LGALYTLRPMPKFYEIHIWSAYLFLYALQEEASTPQRVVLKKVTFKSTGMYRCEVTAVVRKKGSEGYPEIQEFVMKESINRMTVVGKNLKVIFYSIFQTN
jgi:hypothetical protein